MPAKKRSLLHFLSIFKHFPNSSVGELKKLIDRIFKVKFFPVLTSIYHASSSQISLDPEMLTVFLDAVDIHYCQFCELHYVCVWQGSQVLKTGKTGIPLTLARLWVCNRARTLASDGTDVLCGAGTGVHGVPGKLSCGNGMGQITTSELDFCIGPMQTTDGTGSK